MISFITTIKICNNYEWLLDSIVLYIKNIEYFCNKYEIPYEIIIVEQINEKNLFLIRDKYDFSKFQNLNILEFEQNYYNPFDYNLIESYGKNFGLKNAKGLYTCMTSADIIFSENFFVYIKNHLRLECFYRFATYEVRREPFINKEGNIIEILDYCDKNQNKRLANQGCFSNNLNIMGLAQKSGDIMILDTKSFLNIGGWAENICFNHVDLSFCFVVANNFTIEVPNPSICIYTFTQEKRELTEKTFKLFDVSYSGEQIEKFEFAIAISYHNKFKSNY